MTAYRFARDYHGHVNGTRWYVGAGTELDLSDEEARAIEADAPGTVLPVVQARAVEAPPADRMVRKAPKKRGG